jgi:hypothetical protein
VWLSAAYWLTQEASPVPPWSAFAGYGVVGALAFGGLAFAWRVYRVTDAERVALSSRNVELYAQMLTAAERHKDELLKTYQTVMPSMSAAVDALKESSRLIEDYRRSQQGR